MTTQQQPAQYHQYCLTILSDLSPDDCTEPFDHWPDKHEYQAWLDTTMLRSEWEAELEQMTLNLRKWQQEQRDRRAQ